ncbi:MAG: hypothetical protein QF898_07955 [SAR202 cluster bacterium]|nr:hypothetical protein [SAR202 cluster bacterium]MDP6714440.1 hypothetical protein [SAR202 cluster bacterium]
MNSDRSLMTLVTYKPRHPRAARSLGTLLIAVAVMVALFPAKMANTDNPGAEPLRAEIASPLQADPEVAVQVNYAALSRSVNSYPATNYIQLANQEISVTDEPSIRSLSTSAKSAHEIAADNALTSASANVSNGAILGLPSLIEAVLWTFGGVAFVGVLLIVVSLMASGVLENIFAKPRRV